MANKTKEAAAVKIPQAAITQVAQEAIKQVSDAEKAPVKKGIMSKIVSGAGKVLSNPVVSSLVSLIPGVGPIAGPVMARLGSAMSANDDEWFSEYTCAGATFNEMLGLHPEQIFNDSVNSETHELYHMSGCVANIPTGIFAVTSTGLDTTAKVDTLFDVTGAHGDPDCGLQYWKEQLLPTIMADVRRKTGNVLNATEDDYWKAFVCDSWLYSIYYEGKKYLELTKDLPLNIPNLTRLYAIISPKYVAQFEGIINTLGDYLRSTVRLPYAFTEYIRWRFGTLFKSSNTERPGLISYDLVPPHGNSMNKVRDLSQDVHNFAASMYYPALHMECTETIDDAAVINAWVAIIEAIKAAVYKTGRANADIKLAYDDAQIRYDVNPSMFDAKENNLRCNMYQNVYSNGDVDFKQSVSLLMDGRLNAPSAIQNITMSTSGALKMNYDESEVFAVPPFPVYVPIVSLYLIGDLEGTYQDHNPITPAFHDVSLFDGWLVAQVKYGYASFAQSKLQFNDTLGSGFSINYDNMRAIEAGETQTIPSADTLLVYGAITGICALAARSLEFHNQRTVIQLPNYNSPSSADYLEIGGYTLAYDTALVSLSQIDAIQRTAMRNLIRSGYTHKTPEGQREEIKEARNDILEGVISEI